MIPREYIEAELAELERERERLPILLHKVEAGIAIYRMLLEKFDGDLPQAPDPRDESGDQPGGS